MRLKYILSSLRSRKAFYFTIIGIIVTVFHYGFFGFKNLSPVDENVIKPIVPKKIVVWNTYYGLKGFFQNFSVLQCPKGTPPCVLEPKNVNHSRADALLIHVSTLNSKNMPPLIGNKSPQLWVYFNYEPPPFSSRNIFNKMNKESDVYVSYREKSDIYTTYGGLRDRTDEDENNPYAQELKVEDEINFHNKSMAVWLVSNCKASGKREVYAKELQKYMKVDIIGNCGKPAPPCCSKKNRRLICYKGLAERYKFYFAFENAMCTDYVTEKFFLPLHSGMIPVVMGGGDYGKLAPAGSYINVLDFDGPEMLAKHLHKVANDFNLFKEYFAWKQDYVVEFSDLYEQESRRWLCPLCSHLHKKDEQPVNKMSRRNLTNWWFNEDICWSMTNETAVKYYTERTRKTKNTFTGYTGPVMNP